ncbi:MAG: 3-phosphoshikimate 1-carboxyvinyltransferase [Arcanobacterium sp.]|nr:3-phosphoshikimate 1-carboxyvinyltransferase [Arcanobacterium sp.]
MGETDDAAHDARCSIGCSAPELGISQSSDATVENDSAEYPLSVRPVHATVALPGSKSLTNRYLILAALSDAPVTITAPLVARDTVLMAQALENLGVLIRRSTSHLWRIFPTPQLHGAPIDCGLAGTVMRFIPPLAALASGVSVIDGDLAARQRPLGAMVAGLRQLGVRIEADYSPSARSDDSTPSSAAPACDSRAAADGAAHTNDDGTAKLGVTHGDDEPPQTANTEAHLPLRITGTGALDGGVVSIDASASSQFVSGLLLAAPKFTHGLDLRHHGGELPSLPHIRMTLTLLREAGVRVHEYDALGRQITPPDESAQLPETRLPASESAQSSNASAQSADPTGVTPPAHMQTTPHAQTPAHTEMPTRTETPAHTETPVDPALPVRWVVEPGSIQLKDVTVEPDLSNAGPFLAAAMVTGGRVCIPHWPLSTTQPGAELPRIFEAMGGRVQITPDTGFAPTDTRFTPAAQSASTIPQASGTASDSPAYAATSTAFTSAAHPAAAHHNPATAQQGEVSQRENQKEKSSRGDAPAATHGTLELIGPPCGAIAALDMNLHAVGELVPTIAAVAAFARGESHLRDIGQLRGHETNRLAALRAELAKIGVTAQEVGDDLIITPPAVSCPDRDSHEEIHISSYADHRMATFGAILGLRVPHVSVDDVETTEKTLPQFPQRWADMIAQSEKFYRRHRRAHDEP